ncbi:hypothetical protein KCV87_17055 [Actinosynnema pretiosum subsp. pretiosum]|uniref:Secreted protein n=2 Tax=Actinosynnema TaxID=40566 RepID=C6WKR2_ACTMD|nr:hypothetical protein [Actinosynnema mirum]ACU34667.1 hypothetical protein Amir_0704 [Actinosynnema mirum DSM 43827]AXX28026.1 hypothetical protein APASM_0661 [Actinosynnema pretiosum subsp. pretiosum]QUF07568.1 hypothetical protein KCV87_17055 [Actinosynnema pretiosum subsp. pretiosum]
MALSTRFVSFAGAVATAVALTGTAFFTVAHAGCGEVGRFVERGDVVVYVGGCVDGADLEPAPVQADNAKYPFQP